MALIVAFGNPVYDEITTPFAKTPGRVLSGCSTNGCLALTRLGHQTALVGSLGRDFSQQFVADLQRHKIRPYVELGAETGGFRLVYDEKGNRTLELLGRAAEIKVVPEVCANAEAIIIGPILQETPKTLVERIREASKAPLFLDPQGLLRRLDAKGQVEHFNNPELAAIAPWCTVIKANELEALILTGIDPRQDAVEAVRRLRALGCQIAIVTLAEAGSVINDGKQHYQIPAYATDVCDPTGAGDTYMAGFIHAYLQNPHDLVSAGCWGAATSSFWIEQTGPEAPIPAAQVAERTAKLRRQI